MSALLQVVKTTGNGLGISDELPIPPEGVPNFILITPITCSGTSYMMDSTRLVIGPSSFKYSVSFSERSIINQPNEKYYVEYMYD